MRDRPINRPVATPSVTPGGPHLRTYAMRPNQILLSNFGATVCKTVRTMLSEHCPVCLSVCLSVTLLYYGQTVGWIKMKLGMEVGIGPGHSVRWGPSYHLSKWGHSSPQFSAHVLWPNGSMDHDATRYVGRPRPMRHCVGCQPSSPQRGTAPQFSAHVCCGQTAGWIKMPLGTEVGVGSGHIVLDGSQLPPQKKKNRGHSPHFSAHALSIVAKQLDESRRCHLLRR